MAEIVLGVGTSHTPMLFTPPEDWPKYEARDRAAELRDREGRAVDYDALAETADPKLPEALTPEATRRAYDACQAALDRLASEIEAAGPDVVLVVGDDQKELFQEHNLPALLVYWGDQILNRQRRPKPHEPSWWSEALAKYYGRGRDETLPVASKLARHVIETLSREDFDVAQSRALPEGKGEGHAFAFVHSRLLDRRPLPIVPVFINTYYPPNQPTPARCFRLGQALAGALRSWPGEERIAVVASGGLSHFVVDEDLDRGVLRALAEKDASWLAAIPARKLDSGTSEIRNWIAMHGATEHLARAWSEYVPCYRTAAGTGTGCAFGVFR